MTNIKKALRPFLLSLIFLLIYVLLPQARNFPFAWPYPLLPVKAQVTLSVARDWLALPLAIAMLTWFLLQLLGQAFGPIKKRRGLKIAFGTLAAISLLLLVYCTLWALLFLGPPPFMPSLWWMALFLNNTAFPLCLWWIATAVCTGLARAL